jgi:hypothetical protein
VIAHRLKDGGRHAAGCRDKKGNTPTTIGKSGGSGRCYAM